MSTITETATQPPRPISDVEDGEVTESDSDSVVIVTANPTEVAATATTTDEKRSPDEVVQQKAKKFSDESDTIDLTDSAAKQPEMGSSKLARKRQNRAIRKNLELNEKVMHKLGLCECFLEIKYVQNSCRNPKPMHKSSSWKQLKWMNSKCYVFEVQVHPEWSLIRRPRSTSIPTSMARMTAKTMINDIFAQRSRSDENTDAIVVAVVSERPAPTIHIIPTMESVSLTIEANAPIRIASDRMSSAHHANSNCANSF